MEIPRIAALLAPFATLNSAQLAQISLYIDLLLRWNARVNLTAIRDPEEIVTRHFGESLFAARHLLSPTGESAADALATAPAGSTGARAAHSHITAAAQQPDRSHAAPRVIDLGSGAGFPGIPLKIWCPQIPATLIESNQKKVAFLREVVRALTLTAIDVFPARAEAYPAASATLVTLRAVERFATILPTAIQLVSPEGRLALLIAKPQISAAQTHPLIWAPPIPIPQSSSRILLVGHRPHPGASNQ